jgi:hypothetical protein
MLIFMIWALVKGVTVEREKDGRWLVLVRI